MNMAHKLYLDDVIHRAYAERDAALARVKVLEAVFDAAVSLLERGDFWQNCGTVPGEYDNLNEAVAALAGKEESNSNV